MALQKILKKLESLPLNEQEFAAGRYVFQIIDGKPHCGCAVGKVFSEEKRMLLVQSSANCGGLATLTSYLGQDVYYDQFEDKRRKEAKQELDALGATFEELAALQLQNDDFGSGSNDPDVRKLRYWYIIGWLRGIARAPALGC